MQASDKWCNERALYKVREGVTENDFKHTIKSCEMEDCLLPANLRLPDRTICNWEKIENHGYDSIACCSEEELNDVCMVSSM